MIGKKGASCRKDHGQRNILIHKREILLSYEQRRGAYRHVGMGWTKSGKGVSLMPEEANACGERGNALRGRLQVLANVWGKGCKRLRQRMQTFEAKVANVWGKGCKRLRERLQCFASEKGKTGTWIVSPILDKRKGRRDTPLTSHCSPPLMYLVIPDSTSSKEKSIKSNPQKLERFQNRDIPNVNAFRLLCICPASADFLLLSLWGVSVPQGVNRNELDQLLCSHP